MTSWRDIYTDPCTGEVRAGDLIRFKEKVFQRFGGGGRKLVGHRTLEAVVLRVTDNGAATLEVTACTGCQAENVLAMQAKHGHVIRHGRSIVGQVWRMGR